MAINQVRQGRGESRLSTLVGGPPLPGVCSSYSVAVPKQVILAIKFMHNFHAAE